jgi:hypothetical protein
MKPKIGSYSVVHSEALIIPRGLDAWVSFEVQGWNAKYRIVFEEDSKADKRFMITVTGLADHGLIRLVNWQNTSGTASASVEPFQIGSLAKGGRLLAMLTHWYIAGINRLDIEFLVEERQ